MFDHHDTGSQDAPSQWLLDEVAQIVHELAEALTACGNYVAAAAHISDGGKATGDDVRKALEAGLTQHGRASIGLHRLQSLLARRQRA
jgi:hypothetical protein